MLVHICCSVDSHYFLQRLRDDFPNDKIIGFFYDPNIHPYSEYRLRLEDVKYSCDILGIELIEGDYDYQSWLKAVKGLENEPEKGDRCTVCFDKRLEVSVQKAVELNCTKFTTTLLISPKKSQDKLQIIGDKLSKEYNVEFIFKDYRAKNGVELQGKEVKKHNLYRQNYCGCMFGLIPQREYQDRLADELFEPVGQQIQPDSIQERLDLYRYRTKNPNCEIIKQRFLNYRLLGGKVIIKKEVVQSYFLAYSTLKNKKSTGRVEKIINNIGYFNRDEIKIIDLDYFNQLTNSNYKKVLDLQTKPLKFQDEIELRAKLLNNSSYDLSTIIILNHIPNDKVVVELNSVTFDDVKEVIL